MAMANARAGPRRERSVARVRRFGECDDAHRTKRGDQFNHKRKQEAQTETHCGGQHLGIRPFRSSIPSPWSSL
jgi:hypothetical protein